MKPKRTWLKFWRLNQETRMCDKRCVQHSSLTPLLSRDTRKVLVEVNQKLREQEQKEKATYQKMMKTLGGDENTSPIGKPTVTVVAVTDASQVDGVPHVSEDIPPATDEGKAKEATDRIQSEAAPKQKSFIKKLFSWW
jgi:hypothetical protein